MFLKRLQLLRDVFLILFLLLPTTISEVNLAASKRATQSSNHSNDRWLAGAAVDTCTRRDIISGCCTHTRGGGPKRVWWQVDLGEKSTINKIQIIYRNHFKERLAGYQLYVSNTTDIPPTGALCYEDTSRIRDQVQLVVTHQCPYVGRYVTVFNYRDNPKRYNWYDDYAILELCEVEVFGCPVGRYGAGDACSEVCPDSCHGGNCNPQTGSCFYCPPGKYDAFCSNNCSANCNNSECDPGSGYCFDCIPGKYGLTCEQDCSVNCQDRQCEKDTAFCFECIPKRFGNICEQNCSLNCEGQLCDRNTGYCNECIPGKMGNTCEYDCPVNCKEGLCARDTGYCADCKIGKYGAMCDEDCPMYCKDQVCAQSTGFCNACVPPKRGKTCELDCPWNCFKGVCDQDSAFCDRCEDGFYGTNCSLPCSNNCSQCHQESGECLKCIVGVYGINCSIPCGHCTVCERVSGVCETQCDPGYEGSYCVTRQAQTSNLSGQTVEAGPILGAIAGIIIASVIAIVIAVFIRRRRLGGTKHDSFNDLSRSQESLETKAPYNAHATSTLKGEHIYSNTLVPEDNPDEPLKDTSNIYVNTEQVARKSSTGDSLYCNSGVVGYPVSELRSIIQVKMQHKAKAFENEYKAIPSGDLHEHNIGMMQQNKAKNRFKTTFPYDHSRVILDKVENDPYSDYINANYIDSVSKTAEYIATQGPRPGTINDFWRMVWQLKSGKIIMLTNLVEGSRPKCDKYWPDEGEPLSTTHFNIILDRERAYAFYVIRDLTVTEKKTKKVRQIHQFHYTTWPDHGTPDPNELVVFHRRVKQYETGLTGKMVVHCSAGIGRTGTFLALDALLDHGKEFGRIDVLQYVKTMRKNRVNMVQTVDQYIAIHKILAEAFDMPDTLISRMEFHTTLEALSNDGPKNQTKLRKEYHLTQTLKPIYDDADCQAALLPDNKKKNRELDVLAADKYRAYLRSYTNDRTDYINAVAVPSYTSRTGYIVTQTPNEDTLVDLLTMIVDHNCQTIVIIEPDSVDWLPGECEDKIIGGFTLQLKGKTSTIDKVLLLEIAIINQMNGYDGSVRVFHLSGWNSESSLPRDSHWLLQVLELLDSRRKSDDTKTTVVMCRDGYSRSGLFCCISNARDQMKIDEEVDIFEISRQLLVRRPEFLINYEQYQCCYNMIRDYLDATDVYVN